MDNSQTNPEANSLQKKIWASKLTSGITQQFFTGNSLQKNARAYLWSLSIMISVIIKHVVKIILRNS